MKIPSLPMIPLTLLAIAASLASPPARATSLGATADPPELEARALGARAIRIEPHETYSVRVIETGPAEIREYLSPSDQVFALTWTGSHHPPLERILGAYHARYRIALERARGLPRRARGPLRLAGTGLVLEYYGHFRRLQGRAFDPELLPAGVTSDEIR